MEKLLIISTAFFLIVFNACQDNGAKKINNSTSNTPSAPIDASTGPIMTFEKSSHDFGTIKEGEIAKTVFNFTNTGENDLYIVDAIGSCGCTVPKYPKNIAIKPGESGEIEVNFDTNGRPNLQQKMVKITANTTSGGQLLQIQAFVEPKNN